MLPGMSEIVFQITEADAAGGFIARALGYSIVTEADTWEELRANVREAVRCHFDAGLAPAVIRLKPVHEEHVRRRIREKFPEAEV